MRKELTDKLFNDFPALFPKVSSPQESLLFFGIECGDGWFDCIYELCSKIEAIRAKLGPHEVNPFFVTQVKEKFGMLRFYMASETNEMSDLISECETKTSTICEKCGKKGEIKGPGWFLVRCDDCWYSKQREKKMIIDCISDLHGYYPKLEGGDLLIVAGDLTMSDILNDHHQMALWIADQKYKRKIIIGGNHDNILQKNYNFYSKLSDISYLCDSGTEFEGLKIWGSPWTKTFEGMNPNCKAYTFDTDEELAERWALIPDNIDILVTHCPPFDILDSVGEVTKWGRTVNNVGSVSLRNKVLKVAPKLHVFGHIHEWGGHQEEFGTTLYVNASHVDECYDPINKPIRVIL